MRKVPAMFRALFGKEDTRDEQLLVRSETARRDNENAANRFEETVRDLLQENDRITGRNHAHPS